MRRHDTDQPTSAPSARLFVPDVHGMHRSDESGRLKHGIVAV
jgi:hypothetical protein